MTLPATPAARPPALHKRPEIAEDIIAALLRGNTLGVAAKFGGITRKTLHNYIAKGKEARNAREESPDTEPLTPFDDDYISFLEKYEAAEAAIQDKLLSKIMDHGDEKWQANAWILERRFPKDWSTRQTIEHRTEKSELIIFTANITNANPELGQNGDIEEAEFVIEPPEDSKPEGENDPEDSV